MDAEHLLRTPRVVLRPPVAADVEAAIRLETDPEVRRFLGGPAAPEAVAQLRARFTSPDFVPGEGRFVVAAVEHDQVLGLVFLQRERGALEVSYLFLHEHWGRGLAAEAVAAALSWAAATTEDEEVIAVTQAANGPSLRLLATLGFEERERFEEWGAEQVLLFHRLERDVRPAP